MMRQKIVGLLLICVLVLCLAGCASKASEEEPEPEQETEESDDGGIQETPGGLSVGDKAPDVTVQLNNGTSFVLSDHEKEVTLFNFWATWCGPCVGEMPAFEKLYEGYAEDVNFVIVNIQEDRETVDAFIQENEYTFPVGYDEEGEVFASYPSDGIPYTVIVGRDGRVAKIFLGADSADIQYKTYKEALDSVLE